MKAAYHMGLDFLGRGVSSKEEAGSPALPKKSYWTDLWATGIPSKMKHMIWRVCYNVLLTRANLQQREINLDISCPRCNGGIEDDYHIFFGCH